MQRRRSAPLQDWDQARLLLALGRARTVAAAGQALGVDASTVSRRLAALEASLGATLFDRSRDGIAPTEAAEQLLPVAEELEGTMARFSAAAQGLELAVTGVVHLACPPDVAEVLVAPLLPALLARHPGLQLELDPGEAVRDLTRGEADLALRTVAPKRGDLVVTRLTSVAWVPVAAPALASSLRRLRRWTDAPWLGWGERLAGIPPARWLAAALGDAQPRVRCGSVRLMVALAGQGLGVALLPAPTAAAAGLVRVAVAPALAAAAPGWPADDLFLVTHRALRQVPRVRAVWDALLAGVRPAAGAPGG